jgi:excisionase family DNA binding protein
MNQSQPVTRQEFELLMGVLLEMKSEIAKLRLSGRGAAPQILTIDDVCQRWGCSKRTVHRLVADGLLPRAKAPGRVCRWTLEEVQKAEIRWRPRAAKKREPA